jgi:hypothetical protein
MRARGITVRRFAPFEKVKRPVSTEPESNAGA